MTPIDARQRLIVALDVPGLDAARALVDRLDGLVSFYKIGPWLQLAPGVTDYIQELIRRGNRVFIDYKHFDVEETVRMAVSRAASLGITFLTIHGSAGIIRAAVEGKGARDIKLLAVTVLTALEGQDIQEMGFPCSLEELVLFRARKALEAGCDGVIASGQEAERIRALAGDKLLIVSPGIRPSDTSTDEHKRPSSPAGAIAAGADYLVVGRPIHGSPDPRAAAERIVAEMQGAFDGRGEVAERG